MQMKEPPTSADADAVAVADVAKSEPPTAAKAASAVSAHDDSKTTTSNSAAPTVVFRGDALGVCIEGLGARLNGAFFTVTAHAAGGDSPPSMEVELQSAPAPIRFEAEDRDHSCDLSAGDALRVTFDRPTNQPAGQLLAAGDDVTRLLHFSSPMGGIDGGVALTGEWLSADVLELRVPRDAEPSELPATNPLLQRLAVTIQPEAQLVVHPPALSLPARLTSPPVEVPGCFLEGFETARLTSGWVIESVDVSANRVVFDTSTVHSGGRSLRLTGGRSADFDGLARSLPAGSRPKSVSFWLRTASAGDVGYFTLGGASTESSILYFHLRGDGTAGLLSATGGWTSGKFVAEQWLHVRIDLEWPYRRADLWLDGVLIAGGVGFASADAQVAEEVHVFNFDHGTVWWDDLVIRL